MRVTVVESEPPPPTDPQAVKPAAIRSKEDRTNRGTRNSARPRTGCNPSPSIAPKATIHRPDMGKDGFERVGESGSEAAECAVVAMESITGVFPLPAGIVANGEKDAVVPAGNPEATNDTAFAVAAFAGTTIKLKFAG